MEVGGSQRQITHLLTGLDRTRWKPELLYFRNPSFLIDEVADSGLRCGTCPSRDASIPVSSCAMRALLRSGRYDLVHAFSLTAELWTAVARLLVPHAPRQVSSVRGLYLSESPRFMAAQAVRAIAQRCGHCQRPCLRAGGVHPHGIALERFDIVANGVDIPAMLDENQRAALRHSIGVPPGRAFGLFVGRLVREKNPACMLRALAGLSLQSRPWIAIAGDGRCATTWEWRSPRPA
jgi:glycosyltransferase involved in cell wall biosynthesis